MQFGLYFLQQLPRPWSQDAEFELFRDSLLQVELADRLGYDYAWVPEQHFVEEYSHSSAPEVFLAAASQRTHSIRLGHGVVLMPPAYNAPARVAERIATLDLLSAGRIEFGVGDSKSRLELEGFGIDPDERREMTMEALAEVVKMLTLTPYPGSAGKYFSMPARNVVPKPRQKPHPPLWIAASNQATIHRAAQLGIGALAHGFFSPAEAAEAVDDYYETFKRECVPVGETVNPNIAMLNAFCCHADEAEARRIGGAGSGFSTFAVRHYCTFGRHVPGNTNIWDTSRAVEEEMGSALPARGANSIGTPAQIAEHLESFARAGIDQTVFMHRAGRTTHDEAAASLQLFAAEVMPSFQAVEQERQRRKREELAPYVAAAFERKARRGNENPPDLTPVEAYGLLRAPVEVSELPADQQAGEAELERLRRIASERRTS